ncbi:hypothetical protein [Flavihumibacter sp.]|uniref:hypothetical protein n=1 Tax=Flavihumibacter sp. TaxID=1913981 RepID=UPI002FC9C15A
MKYFICGWLFLILITFSINIVGQLPSSNDDRISHTFNYTLRVEAPIWECDITGKIIDNAKVQTAPSNSIFTLIDQNEEYCIIKFWNWNWERSNKKALEFNYVDSSKERKKYFRLANKDFNAKAIKRYRRWAPVFTAGTVIVPVKMRFNKFDFSKDFTIGPSIGAKFRASKYSDNHLNLLLGFGITSVTLDSFSTKGQIITSTDRPALTPSLGIVFEFNNVQIGLFSGLDYISKKEKINWQYQGKPWISFGLGYTILSRQSNKVSDTNGKQDKPS